MPRPGSRVPRDTFRGEQGSVGPAVHLRLCTTSVRHLLADCLGREWRRHRVFVSLDAWCGSEQGEPFEDAADGSLPLELMVVAALPLAEQLEREDLRAALRALAPRARQVLERALVHGSDADEIARDLGMTRGAVRVALHRALRHLRARLLGSVAREEPSGRSAP